MNAAAIQSLAHTTTKTFSNRYYYNSYSNKRSPYQYYGETITSNHPRISSISLHADTDPGLLDDFTDSQNNSLGNARMFITDTTAGGQSSSTQTIEDGILSASGDLVPPRGQPGWVSIVSLLNADGTPADISQYEGIRLKIKINKGMLSLSANSAEITNYDYHAFMLQSSGDGIKEVRIPFSNMRRAWSEQTPLNPSTIVSVSLVAVGMQKGSFAYEIDEIGFY